MPILYPYLPRFLHFICVPILRAIFFVFSKVEVKGLNNLPKNREPLIFASNHASEADSLLVGSFIPRRFRPLFYTAKSKNFYVNTGWRQKIYGGLLFDIFGGYRVNSGFKNYAVALEKHIQVLKDGNSLSIFPEGKRTTDGKLGRPHGGVIYLAEKTGAKIVPVGISGAFGSSFKDFILGRARFTVTFGKPVTLLDLKAQSEKDYHSRAERLMMLIADLL